MQHLLRRDQLHQPGRPCRRAQGITTGNRLHAHSARRLSHRSAALPQRHGPENILVRDDFSSPSTRAARTTLRMGGEFLFHDRALTELRNLHGHSTRRADPIPANIEALFPVWDDPSTWNLGGRCRQSRVRNQTRSGRFTSRLSREGLPAWVQDDWRVTPADAQPRPPLGRRARRVGQRHRAIPPWLEPDRPDDTNNIGPRLGFAYSAQPPDRAARRLRKYFGEVLNNISSYSCRMPTSSNVSC